MAPRKPERKEASAFLAAAIALDEELRRFAALDAGLPELVGQVDSLRQQMASARNKVLLLAQRLAAQRPSLPQPTARPRSRWRCWSCRRRARRGRPPSPVPGRRTSAPPPPA